MAFGLESEDIIKIKNVFAAIPAVEKAVIFGSRAMGNFKTGSDIDIAVSGNLSFNDLLDLDEKLALLGLLYRFDIQNLSSIKDPDVLDHIKRTGKILYP